MTKLTLLEEAQVRADVADNPEGVNADTVVRVFESMKQIRNGECESYDNVEDLFKSLGLEDYL